MDGYACRIDRVDNLPQFIVGQFVKWRPSHVESFNASVRLECLGQHRFMDLDDADSKVEDWRREYNEVRPHSAIGDRTPMSLIQKPWQFTEIPRPPEILT